MTDAGGVGSRRQREEWAALAERFREAALRTRAECERPTDPCATWADHRKARDDWQPPLADLDAPAP